MDKTVRIKLPDGSEVRKHLRGKDENEIQHKIDEIILQSLKGNPISVILSEWKEYHFKTVNLNTRQGYIAPIKDIKEHFGDKYLSDIKPLEVEQFLQELMIERRYARQTLNLRLIVLNQLYQYAILQGYCSANPCIAVKVPKQATKTKRELPKSGAIQAVKDNVGTEYGLMPFFLLYTGCRVGEALALQYEDIDYKNNIIKINKTVVFDNGIPTIQNHTKTDAGNRSIPLLQPLKKQLPKGKGYIFNSDGNPLKKGQLYYQWRQYKKRTGADITPHQLRHAYATILYDAGLPVKDSQLLLGHNSAEVTQNIYTHISEERRAKAFKALDAFVTKVT